MLHFLPLAFAIMVEADSLLGRPRNRSTTYYLDVHLVCAAAEDHIESFPLLERWKSFLECGVPCLRLLLLQYNVGCFTNCDVNRGGANTVPL